MKKSVKPIVSAISGVVFLLSGLVCPMVQAQSTLIESGSSYLANSLGQTSGPEVVTVSWFVVENTVSDVYTYAYTVNNPVGDVILSGSNAGDPETVDYFSLSFDATVAGAVGNVDTPVNGYFQNNGTSGLAWLFPDVTPGNSVLIAYQSALGPAMGNATASDGNAPSPWTSSPHGEQVPVPSLHPLPEPGTTTLLALGLLLLPFRSVLRRRSL